MIRGTPASLIVPTSYHSNPWLQMENAGFEVDTEKRGVELGDVKVDPVTPKAQSCEPDLCRGMYASYLQNRKKMAANPWDHLKTIFLVGIIVLLILWILVYVTSSKLGFL